jgi:two-component system, OmpR family, phosphate regulon sensor histidine kinase PhoR
MPNPKGLAALMLLAILAISGFQVFWHLEQYGREKKAMEIKADMLFREAIFSLQAEKLKLEGPPKNDTSHPQIQITLKSGNMKEGVFDTAINKNVVNYVNIIREKVQDSAQPKKNMVIAMDESRVFYSNDTIRSQQTMVWDGVGPGGKIFQFLYGLDSMQDSLRVKDVEAGFGLLLDKENMRLPFTVKRKLITGKQSAMPAKNEVNVGFANPVSFRLELGNTFPYLLKKMISPILFSIFLIGLTIVTFGLLYKNLLQQRRLTILKNDFISNITHELKTPIATVQVAIEALRNFNALKDPAKTNEYLDISQQELHRLSMLVDKVLRLSMFENREVQLMPEPFDLRDLVTEVAGSFQPLFEKHGAKLQLDYKGDNFIIEADRLHLMSVVYNLLDNSLKYGGSQPFIQLVVVMSGLQAQIQVSDNGMGIPAAYQDKIFEKFFRVPQGNQHNVKGYGLGLSYVAYIIQKHNGHIQVNSENGKGATFIISIPKLNG